MMPHRAKDPELLSYPLNDKSWYYWDIHHRPPAPPSALWIKLATVICDLQCGQILPKWVDKRCDSRFEDKAFSGITAIADTANIDIIDHCHWAWDCNHGWLLADGGQVSGDAVVNYAVAVHLWEGVSECIETCVWQASSAESAHQEISAALVWPGGVYKHRAELQLMLSPSKAI